MDSMSISNTISKASAMESFSIYEAYRADAISRLAQHSPDLLLFAVTFAFVTSRRKGRYGG